MRIIGIGDLVVDYYYLNGNLYGISGGGSVSNIICNLSAFDYDTYMFGVCGNDEEGQISIRALSNAGVNTEEIIIRNTKTRTFHVSVELNENENKTISRMTCPSCSRKRWYSSSKLIDKLPTRFLVDKNNILVTDNLNNKNINIIEQALEYDLECIIDIGHVANLKYLRRDVLFDKLADKFSIVQLNVTVAYFLVKKFELDDVSELQDIFQSKLLIITQGKDGATFILQESNARRCINKKLPIGTKEVDSTGAGDAFLSVAIKCYIECKRRINENVIEKIFNEGIELTSKVVSNIGARSHLVKMENKKIMGEGCICDAREVVKRGLITKKVSTNIRNLEDRVLRAMESTAYDELVGFVENLDNAIIYCIGTGGSFSSAYYAARVLNQAKLCITKTLKPRELLFEKIEMVDYIIFFSYSGMSSDIIQLINDEITNNATKLIITKGVIEKIESKIEDNNTYIITYRNSKYKAGREKGFLSFEGTIAPATLFAKYIYEEANFEIEFTDWFNSRIEHWSSYFKEFFSESVKLYEKDFKIGNTFDIFYGDYSTTAMHDLESKLVESGKYRTTCHEKKNFSHGRFISTEHLGSNLIIYYRSKNISGYERILLEYLRNKNDNILEIISDFDGFLCEFDLLLATQFFVGNLADFINYDLSKPEYSEESMKLYRYKGEL